MRKGNILNNGFKKVDAALFSDEKNTLYFTGYGSSYSFVLFTKEGCYYLTDDRYFEEANALLNGYYQVISVTRATAYETVRSLLAKAGASAVGFEDCSSTYQHYQELENELTTYQLIGIEDELISLMAVKDADEIENVRRASLINDAAFNSLLPFIKEGVKEKDIAIELEYLLRKEGGDGIAFETIVAFGENTSKPHAHAGRKQLKSGMPVTIDFGCTYGGYCSDITRTFFFGEPSEKLRGIYEMVLEANLLGINEVKSGAPAAKVDAACRDYFRAREMDKYFIHGTGHGVGIRVHEAPTLNPSSADILKTDMLVTVEPGLYIPEVGGVRIEDLLLVTENGSERLTVTNKNIMII